MSMTLRFLGAAQTVTGSRYLLDTGARRILVDCGLYQERDFMARNWEPFPVPPATITDVILTHAHLDHCGWLPALTRQGFRGRVRATAATADLARISLLDSARLQEEDAAFKQARHAREGRTGPYPYTPMYTVADVEACCAQFTPVAGFGPLDLGDGVELRFREAGHILVAVSVVLRVANGGDPRTVVFSGDLGRWDKPLLKDPDLCPDADYVVIESTYGDRIHESAADIQERLANVITDTLRRGGNLLIPTFAIERAQEVLFYLSRLLRANRVPHLVTFLDSPMAIQVTELFAKYGGLLDAETKQMLAEGHSPFEFSGLTMTRSVPQSKAINHVRGTAVIMAGAGMCTGGRIKHHLVQHLGRRDSTILFVGYQAQGTLGRQIAEGDKEVRIYGQPYKVRAHVERIEGFSGHADRDELLRWLGGASKPPRHIFVTHGEPAAATAFSAAIGAAHGWPVSVPAYGDTATL